MKIIIIDSISYNMPEYFIDIDRGRGFFSCTAITENHWTFFDKKVVYVRAHSPDVKVLWRRANANKHKIYEV